MAKKKMRANKGNPLRIEGPMTIYEVTDIHTKFIQSIEGEKAVAVDLKRVTDCDASGIQLLVSFLKTAEVKGLSIVFKNISGLIRGRADQIGIDFDRIYDA